MAAAMVSGLDIGLRHVLPVYPFLFVLAISLFKMHGLVPQEIRGFYDRLFLCKPAGRIGYSIYLFDLRRDPDARKCLIDAYARIGATEFAARELARLVEQAPTFPIEPELRRLLPPGGR
jgi:hypothetical protein